MGFTVKIDPEDDIRTSESLLSSRDASTVRTSNSGEEEDKNLANALDLSESEEDEELEDLVDDFLANRQGDDVCPPSHPALLIPNSQFALAVSQRIPKQNLLLSVS